MFINIIKPLLFNPITAIYGNIKTNILNAISILIHKNLKTQIRILSNQSEVIEVENKELTNINLYDKTQAIEIDFLNGVWLDEIDLDYKNYVKRNGSIKNKYWEETYCALKRLWDKEYYKLFIDTIESEWKDDNYDYYEYIVNKTNKGWAPRQNSDVIFHVECHCPSSMYFIPHSKIQAVINFQDPQKEYLNPLKSAIKSMHLDLYNAYRMAKNSGQQQIIDGIFYSQTDGCLDARIRRIEKYSLECLKGLPFDQLVQMILSDYTYKKCILHNWPQISYNELAEKDDGKHFCLEDIVEFGEKYHAEIKSIDNKTIKDLTNTLREWTLCDDRATVENRINERAARIEFYNCPISFELMVEPMITACGHNFEKVEIERWFIKQEYSAKKNAQDNWQPEPTNIEYTCPICKQPAKPCNKNFDLKQEIQAYKSGGHKAAEATLKAQVKSNKNAKNKSKAKISIDVTDPEPKVETAAEAKARIKEEENKARLQERRKLMRQRRNEKLRLKAIAEEAQIKAFQEAKAMEEFEAKNKKRNKIKINYKR